MLRLLAPALVLVLLTSVSSAQTPTSWLDPFRANAGKLIAAATADQFAWDRLAELTDTYGQRLSGSENLNRAIAWAVETMKKDGLENVHTERVMIPRWVRGNESLEIINPPHHVVPMLGLGGSVATPPAGIEADVMVVSSGDDLAKRAAQAKGKIVLFNVPYTNYGETVAYRSGGASMAARHGAVGMLVRAVGPDRSAHAAHRRHERTPPMSRRFPPPRSRWKTRLRIQRLVNRGVAVRVRLKMEARVRSRRRILQRRRRDSRQREARRRSCSSAVTSIPGIPAPARRTMRSAAS